MNTAKYRITAIALMTFLICSVFSSCVDKKQPIVESSDSVEPYAFDFTDNTSSLNANIYSIDLSDNIRSKVVNIEFNSDLSPLNTLIETVLSQKDIGDLLDIKLTNSVLSDNVCFIFFQGALSNIESWIRLETVLLATLHDFCNIDTVAMFLDESALIHNNKPITAGTIKGTTIENFYLQRKEITAHNNVLRINYAICFLPIENSAGVRAVSTEINNYDDYSMDLMINNILSTQINELSFYHDYTGTEKKPFKCVLDSKLSHKKDGKICLDLTANSNNVVVDDQIKKIFALSLFANVPGIKQISFSDNKQEIYTFDKLRLELATSITAYYPMSENSTLNKKKIYIKSDDCYDLYEVLSRMLNEREGTYFPLITTLDSVYISNGTVAVNFKKGTRDRMLDCFVNSDLHYDSPEMRERLLIFSIINTLTEYPSVNRVMFYEDNKVMENLLNINLKRPIYRNPGLIAE